MSLGTLCFPARQRQRASKVPADCRGSDIQWGGDGLLGPPLPTQFKCCLRADSAALVTGHSDRWRDRPDGITLLWRRRFGARRGLTGRCGRLWLAALDGGVMVLQFLEHSVGQILEQMPAIGYLQGVRRPLANASCVCLGTATTDGLHAGVVPQPGGECLRSAIREHYTPWGRRAGSGSWTARAAPPGYTPCSWRSVTVALSRWVPCDSAAGLRLINIGSAMAQRVIDGSIEK